MRGGPVDGGLLSFGEEVAPENAATAHPVEQTVRAGGAVPATTGIEGGRILPFLASAGIGGVHLGAGKSMDISAALIRFTRSKVAVVCAGAKNLPDLGRPMAYLETRCVPIRLPVGRLPRLLLLLRCHLLRWHSQSTSARRRK